MSCMGRVIPKYIFWPTDFATNMTEAITFDSVDKYESTSSVPLVSYHVKSESVITAGSHVRVCMMFSCTVMCLESLEGFDPVH